MKTKTKNIILSCILFVFFNFSGFSQIIFGPEDFSVDNILHGTTGNPSQWFAPDYYSPIDYIAIGSCTGASVGFSGNWLNYWGNFLRTPAINCTGNDTVYLHFSLSNSFIASQSANKIYFNMWVDGAYHNAFSNQTIFFDSLRNCVEYTVGFDLTPYMDLSGVFFYFNASCGYNNSNLFSFELDNISLSGKNGIHTNSDFYKENEKFDIYSYDNTITIANPSYTNYIVNVYNLLGSLILSEKQYGNTEFQIKPGMYIVQIQSKNKSITKKIILQ